MSGVPIEGRAGELQVHGRAPETEYAEGWGLVFCGESGSMPGSGWDQRDTDESRLLDADD